MFKISNGSRQILMSPIYIYIYMYVCVCVCVCQVHQLMEAEFRKDCLVFYNTLFPRVKGEGFMMLKAEHLHAFGVVLPLWQGARSNRAGEREGERERERYIYIYIYFFFQFKAREKIVKTQETQGEKRNMGEEDKDEKEEKSMKWGCSSKMFDEHVLQFLQKHGGEMGSRECGAVTW